MGTANARPQAALALVWAAPSSRCGGGRGGRRRPRVRCKAQVPTETERGAAHVMAAMEGLAARVLSDYRAHGAPVPVEANGAAALGCPDAAGQRVAFGANLMEGWTGMPVAANMARALGVPCVLLGDVQAHALGEARWGAAAGAQSCLCVAPGTGLGGGLVIDGKLVRGAHGLAGHLGHMQSARPGHALLTAASFWATSKPVTSGVGIGALYPGADIASADFDPRSTGPGCTARVERRRARRAVLAQSGFALGSGSGRGKPDRYGHRDRRGRCARRAPSGARRSCGAIWPGARAPDRRAPARCGPGRRRGPGGCRRIRARPLRAPGLICTPCGNRRPRARFLLVSLPFDCDDGMGFHDPST